jgi:hypothetical protein
MGREDKDKSCGARANASKEQNRWEYNWGLNFWHFAHGVTGARAILLFCNILYIDYLAEMWNACFE